jgi:hypothetical protein
VQTLAKGNLDDAATLSTADAPDTEAERRVQV